MFWQIFGNLRNVVRNLWKIIKNAVISMSIEHYMLPQRYAFCVRVARTISYLFAALTREMLFLPLERKIHIFLPPCNILYISNKPSHNFVGFCNFISSSISVYWFHWNVQWTLHPKFTAFTNVCMAMLVVVMLLPPPPANLTVLGGHRLSLFQYCLLRSLRFTVCQFKMHFSWIVVAGVAYQVVSDVFSFVN